MKAFLLSIFVILSGFVSAIHSILPEANYNVVLSGTLFVIAFIMLTLWSFIQKTKNMT